jgi:hypothetical protein
MSEIEVFRLTPTKGKHYYAILATRSYWDKQAPAPWGKGNHRYFAKENEKRYMGVFESSWNSGSGDGKTYTEIYIRDGKRIELNFDYEGNTCLIEMDPLKQQNIINPEENLLESKEAVPIDKQIAPSRY